MAPMEPVRYQRLFGTCAIIVSMDNDFASYVQYHHSQHKSTFNVVCVVVSNVLLLGGTSLLLIRSLRRRALGLLGAGTAIAVAGHVVDGTLGPEVRGLTHHPIWHSRADADLVRSRLIR